MQKQTKKTKTKQKNKNQKQKTEDVGAFQGLNTPIVTAFAHVAL